MKIKRERTRSFMVALALLCCSVRGLSLAQNQAAEEKKREEWQRVSDVFQAMRVRPGATVADVGAGGGFFTTRLASAVGQSGQVIAVDVEDAQLERLRRRLAEESHSNVTVVKGTSDDPRLARGSLDAALIVNAYHEMTEHHAVLEAIRAALKPGGRLVIVEPISDTRRDASRAEQTREHEIAPELVLREARAAGFHIVGMEDPFTIRGRTVEWMLVLTPRPSGAGALTESRAEVSTVEPSADWKDPALRIPAGEFFKLFEAKAVTVVDVRDSEMFAKGHIPGAVLHPLESIAESRSRLKDLKQPIVTYCS